MAERGIMGAVVASSIVALLRALWYLVEDKVEAIPDWDDHLLTGIIVLLAAMWFAEGYDPHASLIFCGFLAVLWSVCHFGCKWRVRVLNRRADTDPYYFDKAKKVQDYYRGRNNG